MFTTYKPIRADWAFWVGSLKRHARIKTVHRKRVFGYSSNRWYGTDYIKACQHIWLETWSKWRKWPTLKADVRRGLKAHKEIHVCKHSYCPATDCAYQTLSVPSARVSIADSLQGWKVTRWQYLKVKIQENKGMHANSGCLCVVGQRFEEAGLWPGG